MKTSSLIAILCGASMTLFIPAAHAGNIAAGKAKFNVCAGCHGAKGISSSGKYPNLAGQHAEYVTKQLKAFRGGARKDPLMSGMAKPLSDADIGNLAAYIQTLK